MAPLTIDRFNWFDLISYIFLDFQGRNKTFTPQKSQKHQIEYKQTWIYHYISQILVINLEVVGFQHLPSNIHPLEAQQEDLCGHRYKAGQGRPWFWWCVLWWFSSMVGMGSSTWFKGLDYTLAWLSIPRFWPLSIYTVEIIWETLPPLEKKTTSIPPFTSLPNRIWANAFTFMMFFVAAPIIQICRFGHFGWILDDFTTSWTIETHVSGSGKERCKLYQPPDELTRYLRCCVFFKYPNELKPMEVMAFYLKLRDSTVRRCGNSRLSNRWFNVTFLSLRNSIWKVI